ncbi:MULTISPECIES: hypothetical protein [unclassified Streptomyces]|uniref:hypothetical protein n=1 Tax=unclassified Streptomyces TaxID=2593676 RepID=UPI0006FC87F4|nr:MULTISPECIES: hypothetical protein [unclassified Streptomyces]KQX58862.1 hypothetical protein ASD33_00685 [Streptomyces sp. Root1304]KRB00123.1 hypothetical protein ASE09_00685 [Streptomyces sp. Root66D1]
MAARLLGGPPSPRQQFARELISVKKTSRPALYGLAALTLVAGALFGGRGLEGDEREEGPSSRRQQALASQLERFRGDNGLFVDSFAAVNRPGLYQSAYALSALHTLGYPAEVTLPDSEIRQQLLPWLDQDPLWGHYYFALLEQATGKTLHTEEDVDSLHATLTDAGYFRDPSPNSPPDSDSTEPLRLSQTVAALEALKQFDSPASEAEAEKIRSWLRKVRPSDRPPQMVVEYHLARAFELIGSPIPRSSKARTSSWSPPERPASAESRSAQLTDTAAYVLLAGMTGVDISPRRAELKNILRTRDGELADPQLAWMVARALNLLPDQEAAAPLTAELRRHLLKNGLASRAQSHLGTLGASYLAQRLRLAEGLPTADSLLRAGLESPRIQEFRRGAVLDRAVWLTTYRLAGGHVSKEEERAVRASLRDGFPHVATAENIQELSHYVDTMQILEEPVPGFTVTRWTGEGRASRNLLNLLVFNLSRTGHLGLLDAPPSPTKLIAEAEAQLSTATVTEASLTADAASSLGWVTDGLTSRRLRKKIEDRTGCDEGSLMVRDTTDSDECSISATLAAARFSQLLEVPGAGAEQPSLPESEDRS